MSFLYKRSQKIRRNKWSKHRKTHYSIFSSASSQV